MYKHLQFIEIINNYKDMCRFYPILAAILKNWTDPTEKLYLKP